MTGGCKHPWSSVVTPFFCLKKNGKFDATTTAFMRNLIATLIVVSCMTKGYCQTWSGATPGNIYYTSGNVGIGTMNHVEKLTVEGNVLLTGASPFLKVSDRLILQMPMALENSWARSFVGQNLKWNDVSKKWSIQDQNVSDFSMLRFENNGTISFFNKPYTGPTPELSNAELEAFRRLTIDYNGNVGIGTSNPSEGLLQLNAQNNNQTALRLSNGNFSIGGTGKFFVDAPGITGGRFLINEIGNVGIGTTNPQALLDVSGQLRIGKMGLAGRIDFARPEDGNYQSYLGWSSNEVFTQYFSGGGSSYRIASWANNQVTDLVTVLNSGNVGIGTTDPGSFKLAVEGKLGARKVVVTQTVPWPDYVFQPTYRLRSLKEVEQFIQQYKHLPEVPSAKEVEANGLDVGENQAVLLKKIEELTLYLIELKKENEKMHTKVQELEKKVLNLKG